MKHLFIVHSHITYLMSLAIVRYLNIKNDDVRILSYNHLFHPQIMPIQIFYLSLNENVAVKLWGIERSGFFNGREKWAKGFENQRV